MLNNNKYSLKMVTKDKVNASTDVAVVPFNEQFSAILVQNHRLVTNKELADAGLNLKDVAAQVISDNKGMFLPLEVVISRMMGKMLPDDYESEMPLYVLSTQNEGFGAAIAYNKDYLDEVLKNGSEFVFIPSSVHEWLVAPISFLETVGSPIQDVIQAVNANVVDEADQLSANPYFYSKVTRELYDSEMAMRRDVQAVNDAYAAYTRTSGDTEMTLDDFVKSNYESEADVFFKDTQAQSK